MNIWKTGRKWLELRNHELRAAEKVQQSKLNINAGAVTFFAIFLRRQCECSLNDAWSGAVGSHMGMSLG